MADSAAGLAAIITTIIGAGWRPGIGFGWIRAVQTAGTHQVGGRGHLVCAVLIGSSVAMNWYSSPDSSGGGSGFELLQHEDEIGIAADSNAFIGGFDADGWYESYLGPGVTILFAVGLTAVGLILVLHHAGRLTLLGGLWLALSSWLVAAGTASVDPALTGEPGPRLWLIASVAASAILGWAVVRSQPGRIPETSAWIGLTCVLAYVPLALVVFGLEDEFPFAAPALLIGNALLVAVPAAGAVTSLEVVRSEPRRPARLVPSAMALVLSVLLWGTALLALVPD